MPPFLILFVNTPIQSAGRLITTRPSRAKIASVIRRFKLLFLALVTLTAIPAQLLLGADKKADERSGAALFRAQDCGHCHIMNGVGGKKGPELTNINKDKLWPPGKITSQILNGGQKMPPFSDALTDAQIAQVVAYLKAKHRPVPPPSANPPAPAPSQ